MKIPMLDARVPPMFCPNISTTPREILEARYNEAADRALMVYPGAKGDPLRALSFAVVHGEMSSENAKAAMSAHFEALDAARYAARWVERWIADTDLNEAERFFR